MTAATKASASGASSATVFNPPPDVSVIIVNWNSKAHLRNCLSSLMEHTRGVHYEIIVADNGSFDGCEQMLAEEFPQCVFIQSPENIGFARANNLASRHASAPYLLFLNPDTEFIQNSIPILLSNLRDLPNVGAVGCRLLNSDRTLQTSCVQAFPTVFNQILDSDLLRNWFPRWKIWGTEAFARSDGQPVSVDVVSGACISLKRQVFEAINGFTAGYFMYAEDADLCRKIVNLGHRVYYVPTATIVHHGGASSDKATNNFASIVTRESVFRYIRDNDGLFLALLYRIVLFCSAVFRLMALLVSLFFSPTPVLATRRMSILKWAAILRWSLGFEEGWARLSLRGEKPSIA